MLIDKNKKLKIAIIGGGWAGLSAAYYISKKSLININYNCQIDIFESSNLIGGRARSFNYKNYILDNGQHILAGAYHNTLNLITEVGKSLNLSFKISDVISEYNLQWHVKNKFNIKDINLSYINKLNLGLNSKLLINILYSNLSIKFKFEFIFIILKLKLSNYNLPNNNLIKTVNDWYIYAKISSFMQDNFFTPLCLSILNTNIEFACIKRFLYALKLTLGSNSIYNAQLLVPKIDLSSLFALPIIKYINKISENNLSFKFNLYLSQAIINIQKDKYNNNEWVLNNNSHLNYDILILAAPYNITRNLLSNIQINLPELEYMPITTIYVETLAKFSADIPFLVFKEDIIFQKNENKQNNVWAIVCSAKYLNDKEAENKLNEYKQEFKQEFKLIKRICEKRATYKCTPSHPKISNNPYDNLYLCGDYLHTHYPATLEAAVESGLDVANHIFKNYFSSFTNFKPTAEQK